MKAKLSSLAALTICLLFLASRVFAANIPVANTSFETLPVGGLNIPCGGSCFYSAGRGIPGWKTTGYYTGQHIFGGFAGNPPAHDGKYMAYTNRNDGTGGGTISQDVAKAVAGEKYTLQVKILHRTDSPLAGVAQLEINGVVVATATGIDHGPGTWSNWSAVYTATPADAEKTLTIVLSGNGDGQADFDLVQLDGTLP